MITKIADLLDSHGALAWPWLLAGLIVVGLVSPPLYNLLLHPLRKIPGPRPFAATRLDYTRMFVSGQAHSRLLTLHRQYGDVVRVSPNEVSVMGVDVWDELMGHRKGGAQENGKDPLLFAAVASNSILAVGRERHAQLRRVLSHGFSAATIAAQEPIITQYVDLLLQKLRQNGNEGSRALEMTSWYNWTTFDVIGDLAFGESFRCLQDGDYHPWVDMIFKRVRHNNLLVVARRWGWLEGVARAFIDQSGNPAMTGHAQLVQEKLRARAALETTRPDFYHSMALQEGERKFSPAEIHDNSSTLIVAGSETTATALSAVTYLLCKNPEVLRRLVDEVRSAFHREDDITIRSVQGLDYMLAVLNEALRMYPPVPVAIPRQMNPEGGHINGHWIPGNTVVGIPQYALYRNPKYFHLPDSFVPERWLGDARFDGDVKKAFQPFSFGPRNCIGKNLAIAEMRLILARVIWNFDIRLAEDSDGWIERSKVFAFWSKPDLNVFLVPVDRG